MLLDSPKAFKRFCRKIWNDAGKFDDNCPVEITRREAIACILHDRYEGFAAEEGWSTQKKSRVDFCQLPDANKRVMLRMADLVISLIEDEKQRVLDKILPRATIHAKYEEETK